MTAILKNVYLDDFDDIVQKYNDTVYKTIKMKPFDVTSDSYAEDSKDSNEKDPKFKVGNFVKISKYKSIFARGYTENLSEEGFVIRKMKNTIPWSYGISDLNGEETDGVLYE